MTKTKRNIQNIKWQCPICGDIRFEKTGEVPVMGVNELGQSEVISYGGYFQCKGCSVHFSNPRLFSSVKNENK